ncbi:hypothetical protein AB4089_04115 [Arthrobacter sp. 2MCAF15]|uniref:hypothetical protein n=1 Tax=Arthrobacter sp. 2MCAF15 TaxID=3232984 RepID=UPI003F918DC5
MKTKTIIVLTTAGILLTGSAALAVNVQTLNGPQPGTTSPANTVLLPQNSTSTTSASPASTPSPSTTVEDRSPAPSPSPSASDDRSRHTSVPTSPPAPDDQTTARSPVPAPAPTRASEPGDDHGGHGKSEPGDDKHSGSDD